MKIKLSFFEIKKGMQFNEWTVIKPMLEKRNKKWHHLVKCKCDAELSVGHYRLTDGTSRMCKSCASTKHGISSHVL